MSRVINTQSPTKTRNQHRRTAAEILRRLGQKQQIDGEAKDMAAMLVYLMRELWAGVESSAAAWEKRDYWMKAERFMREWEWTVETAVNIEDVLRHDAFDLLPELLIELFPRFADVQVKKMTRSPSVWSGAFARLMAEEPTAVV